ncbi:carbamoyl-phosphate synthase domain-containing protein, partial [Richelia intracellularis]
MSLFDVIPALLVLADGTTYHGWSFGAAGTTIGEVLFNTSITGYQEVLTDPSYRGQIVI